MSKMEVVKNVVDFTSLGTFLGYVIQLLPEAALIFTVIWTIFRVLEMKVTHAIAYRLFGWRMDKWLLLPGQKQKDSENE